MDIDIVTWTAGAVIVVGVIQWAKGAIPMAPAWTWTILLPLVSLGAATASAVQAEKMTGLFWDAAGIWAISQLGYEIIIQTIKKKLGGAQ